MSKTAPLFFLLQLCSNPIIKIRRKRISRFLSSGWVRVAFRCGINRVEIWRNRLRKIIKIRKIFHHYRGRDKNIRRNMWKNKPKSLLFLILWTKKCQSKVKTRLLRRYHLIKRRLQVRSGTRIRLDRNYRKYHKKEKKCKQLSLKMRKNNIKFSLRGESKKISICRWQ